MICKYCGKEIPKGEVWNPDENGNGYHHKCLIDMEFDENETYIENLKNRSIILPDNATNGDVIKIMFPNSKTWEVTRDDVHCAYIEFKDICEIKSFPLSWWYAPYKKEVE